MGESEDKILRSHAYQDMLRSKMVAGVNLDINIQSGQGYVYAYEILRFLENKQDIVKLFLHHLDEDSKYQFEDIDYVQIGQQDLLFVTCSGDGLLLFDISDIANPTILIHYESTSLIENYYHQVFYNAYFDGSYCYIQTQGGIILFDFSDINSPELIFTIDSISNFRDLKIKDNLLFILTYFDGCYIFDIENINYPQEVCQISYGSNIQYYKMALYVESKIIITASYLILEVDYSSFTDPLITAIYREYGEYSYDLLILDN